MARKRKSKPTSKRRAEKQQVKERYSKAREDAQLLGLIPTAPEGALRDERVNPSSQGEQDTTSIDRKAIRQGWAVPEEKKAEVVDRLLEKVNHEETSPAEMAMCANALLKADRIQHERDHPELYGRGSDAPPVNINNQNNVVVVDWSKMKKQVTENGALRRGQGAEAIEVELNRMIQELPAKQEPKDEPST